MRILLIGSGGREHALCWKLAQSPLVEKIFTAPGNPGTAGVPKNENIAIPADNAKTLLRFAAAEGIDLTVVGPEKPLADGITDLFRERNLMVFGPSKQAARLEASKRFAKEMMKEAGIPTAEFETLVSYDQAAAYLKKASYPLVLKADGLASGKGVEICETPVQAAAFAARVMKDGLFGEAGKQIVAEEFLEGEEASFLVIADGTDYLPLAGAQDHKRLEEGEKGPNTGGMGAYSPAPVFTDEVRRQTEETVVRPLLAKMAEKGTPFSGILYTGLMLTPKGPKVLEFNVRFGDPETQAVLPRLESDLAETFYAAARGRVSAVHLKWSEKAAFAVVLASKGYPSSPKTGVEIRGVEKAAGEALVFHAGTKLQNGRLVTAGGRVFTVSALGKTLQEAAEQAYRAAGAIAYDGKTFRRDIGWRALQRRNG